MHPYQTLIERYARKISDTGLEDEAYKWQDVQRLQGRPDVDATDLAGELQAVSRTNLLYSLSAGVMVALGRKAPDAYRAILRALFDESIDLQSRLGAYSRDSEALFATIRDRETSKAFQDERTAAWLLTLRNPGKYAIYKDSFYRKLCRELGVEPREPGEKYVHYLQLVRELVDDHLAPNGELISLVRSQLPADAHPDPGLRILAQDLLFQTLDGEANSNVVEPDPAKPRVWLYAPGPGAERWEEFASGGIMAIGFAEMDDLTTYADRDAINAALASHGRVRTPHDSLACWEFSRVMKVGDYVLAKRGRSAYIGLGIVESAYAYDANRPDYRHLRHVRWIKKGEWPADFKLVTKTLTDITKYPDYVRKLKELIGFGGAAEPSAGPLPIVAAPSVESVSHWWLNANPRFWDLSEYAIGSLQTYTTHADSGSKRRIYKYFEMVKPGDLVIGYETTPRKRVVARLVVTQGLFRDEDNEESIEFRVDAFYPNRPTWEHLQATSELAGAEVFQNNQGSLFRLAPEEFEAIERLASERPPAASPYTLESATNDSFLDPDWLAGTLTLWRRKKNLVLKGPPGTGKTFVAERLAWLLMQEIDPTRLHLVQFHPSYSYEDFVQGYRPDGRGGFQIRPGHFLKFCRRAEADPARPYVFVIDEINRGNLGKVFGEAMLAVEADYRDKPVQLQCEPDQSFCIPSNVYLIGTMNTADRSLALVDYALRRRFVFRTMVPDFSDRFEGFLRSRWVAEHDITRICKNLMELNDFIDKDASLGAGYQVGHSYFCRPPREVAQLEGWYESVVRFELEPLLEEYWFDQPNTCRQALEILKK